MRPNEQINDLDKVLCKAEVSSTYPRLLIVASKGAFHTWHCLLASVCKKGIISLSNCHHPASVYLQWSHLSHRWISASQTEADLHSPTVDIRLKDICLTRGTTLCSLVYHQVCDWHGARSLTWAFNINVIPCMYCMFVVCVRCPRAKVQRKRFSYWMWALACQ